MTARTVREIRSAHPSRDGDGVAISRIAGMQHAGMDPFLMLDELRAEQRGDIGGGFPPHPHRGMQTLTYMKRGGIVHEDSEGNRGEIRGGGAQWMSAGRGIIHSEMPTLESGTLHGFQLWVNLPRSEKMSSPRYRDVPAALLAEARGQGYHAVAIAGEWWLEGAAPLSGPLHELAQRAAVLDLALMPETEVSIASPQKDNLLAYVYEGELACDGRSAGQRQMLITGHGSLLRLRAGTAGGRALLLRGQPLGEPVAHYGPFVMNSAEEIEQTLRDYQAGRFPGAN